MFADNSGAVLMADAAQPTKRTRHIDIRHFALLDWVENDLIALEKVATTENISDLSAISYSTPERPSKTTVTEAARHGGFLLPLDPLPLSEISIFTLENIFSLQNPYAKA